MDVVLCWRGGGDYVQFLWLHCRYGSREVDGSDFVDYCAVNACVAFDVLDSCDDSYGVGECLCGEVVDDVVAGC